MDLLKETLARLINQHTASSELLLWFGRERTEDFVDILGPEVFRAMLTAMERDQFNEKRSNRLRDFILEDQALIAELTASADIEVVKDLTRALQLSPVFDDMDKRSLLARLVKAHPAVQSLITGEQTKQEAGLLVSWESLERRRLRIPGTGGEKNSRQLQGNRHRPQLRRFARKPRIQGRQGNAENSHAPQGGTRSRSSTARAARILPMPEPTSSGRHRGAGHRPRPPTSRRPSRFWARGIPTRTRASSAISRPSRMSLLNRKVGDEVEFELHGGKHRHRIEKIEAWKTEAPAAPPP